MSIIHNGTTSRYTYANHTTKLNLTGAFTVMLWINHNSLPGVGGASEVLAKVNNVWIQLYKPDTLRLENVYKVGATTNVPYLVISPTLGQIYHWVAVHDTTAAKDFFYINGVQYNPTGYRGGAYNGGAIAADTSYDWGIGCKHKIDGTDTGACVDATMEDARMYNAALSAAEILTIYNAQGHDNIIHNLVCRFPLNDHETGFATNGSIADVSGNKLAGQNVGGLWSGSMLSYRTRR